MKRKRQGRSSKVAEGTLSVTMLPNGTAYVVPVPKGKDPNRSFAEYVERFETLYAEHRTRPDVYEVIAREMGLTPLDDAPAHGPN